MPKDHIKRMAAPSTWEIPRKTSKFIVRPSGYLETGMPVAVILRETLKLSATRFETKKIMQAGKVSIDGKTVKDERQPVVLMSVMKVGDAAYRMLLSRQGKLFLKPEGKSHEAAKPCKVIGKKTLRGGKTQIAFHDGRTMILAEDAKVGDTFVFKTPEFKHYTRLKLEKGAKVYLTGGSNVGETGIIESISSNVIVKMGENVVEAQKENAFVIGDSIQAEQK